MEHGVVVYDFFLIQSFFFYQDNIIIQVSHFKFIKRE